MNTIDRVIQLAKIVILAQLLPPSDFGLIGIGFLVLAVFKQFSSLGIDASLIQRKERYVDDYLDTAWVILIVRGVVITAVAYVSAPFIAALFNEPRATMIIRVLALSPLIQAFRNPGTIYFTKELKYHKQFVQILSGTVVNFAVAVAFGLAFQNVWALVFGSLAGDVTGLVVSYYIHDYRPRLQFDIQRAKEMLDYGKWIFGMVSLRFFLRQGDDAFVGWFLGATALGYYQMAYRFSNAPATEISEVISNVLFPTYSQIQDDRSKLRSGFYRSIQLTTFIAFPAATGIVAVAPLFVPAFLGSDWLPVIPIMQLLAVYGLLRSITATMGSLFQAVGRPDIITKLIACQVIFIAVFIYPATAEFGLLGTGLVIILAGAVVDTPLSLYLAVDIVDGSYRELGKILFYPVVGSLLMSGAILLLQRSFTSGVAAVDLIAAVVAGAVLYAAYSIFAIKLLDYEIERQLRTIYESFA